MTTDQKDFLSDKKESIGLVIYQISQLDKTMTSLSERMDVMLVRLEGRIQSIELWKAGFNQKVATQEQIDQLKAEQESLKKIIWFFVSAILLSLLGAGLKLLLKV